MRGVGTDRNVECVIFSEVGDKVVAIAFGIDEEVSTFTTLERVITRPADERVIALTAEQIIFTVSVFEIIIAVAAVARNLLSRHKIDAHDSGAITE